MRKLSIYLADLVHNSVVKGPFTMPLNIGFVAAYTRKYFAKDIEIKLFKFPLELIGAIKQNPPDILGLGHYSWNADLNYRIAELAKNRYSSCVTVFGGPNFPIDTDDRIQYLLDRPSVDFYVTNQGEKGFLNLVKEILGGSEGRQDLKETVINGCAFLNTGTRELTLGQDEEVEGQILDEIPSPYLSGILDDFFNTQLNPIIETDRGCPYTCTFCAWGKNTNQKVRPFSIERVKDELGYIANHSKNANLLFIANANFGILERDKEIAQYIKRHSLDSGYPRKVLAAWAKNTPRRVIDMAEVLGDMVEVTMSFQSLDEGVLKNIKRSNIKTSAFMEIQNHFAKKGVISSSEVILGLPGETKESHLNTLRALFDIGAGDILCYNLRALDGSILNTPEQRAKYGIKTKFRLYDIGFGKYDGLVSIEADEIVRSTNTLSEEDILFFRTLHWLIQFLWSFKYYTPLLKYLQLEQIHPLDFMLRFILDRKDAPQEVRELLSNFEEEARHEWFDSKRELFDHYFQKENFEKITKGDFGKLNYKYMFKVLCEVRDSFDIHLANIAKRMLGEKLKPEARKATYNIIDNLIRYMAGLHIDFDANLDFGKEKRLRFDYDIEKWQQDQYKKPLSQYYEPEGISYLFHIPAHQYEALINSLGQFKHQDRNVTLRKMSECIRKTDLLYKVLTISAQEPLT